VIEAAWYSLRIGGRAFSFVKSGSAVLLAAMLCSAGFLSGEEAPPLMPMPVSVHFEDGSLRLTHRFRFDWHGAKDELLKHAADRFAMNLNRRTGIDFVRDDSLSEAPVVIAIDCKGADPNFLTTKAEESYRLRVTAKGVEIEAAGPTGVLRALATLLQLVQEGSEGFGFREVSIEDHPRFVWRGIMLDISRHFMPAKLIEHEIDAMEQVKLNVLHLHITDSESFSMESKVFPLLYQKGAPDGRYLTQDELREIIAYARERGVRVVPEIEMPGHMKSWLPGYPELASGPGPFKAESDYAGADAALNPTDEKVYKFIDNLIGEMAGLFPDAYFHIGGDEVLGKQWASNAGIQQFMKDHSLKNKGELQAYFTKRVNDIVRAHGKTMIGWDEVLDGDAPPSVAIEAWRSSRMTAVSVKAGHATIVAAPYYLDWLMPAGKHYVNDPLDTNAWGMSEEDYDSSAKEDGLLTNAVVLHGEIRLSPEERELVLGGDAPLWSETITPEMLDAGLWPRSAALAERFWSPREVKDVEDMYRRLYVIDRLLAVLGTNQYANQERMLDRIAPQDPGPLKTLAGVVEPIKFLSHWHSSLGGKQPDQNTLADASLPESLEARRFCDGVHALLTKGSGDKELSGHLTSQLKEWQNNDASLVRSFGSIPNWQPAIETSADLRDLATIGLDAMGFLATKQTPAKAWVDSADLVIQKQQKYFDANARNANPAVKPAQPASEVLIMILPGIKELAKAAERVNQ